VKFLFFLVLQEEAHTRNSESSLTTLERDGTDIPRPVSCISRQRNYVTGATPDVLGHETFIQARPPFARCKIARSDSNITVPPDVVSCRLAVAQDATVDTTNSGRHLIPECTRPCDRK